MLHIYLFIVVLIDLDDFDKKILRELQRDNRISSEQLGQMIGLSATACQRRLKRLRVSKVISKEIAVLNGIELDNYVTVIVNVVMKQGGTANIDNFKQRMQINEHVQQCFYVTGDSDFILVITAKNMLMYEQLTQKLFFVDDNIQKFSSMVVMDNVKTGLSLPI